MHAGTKLNWSWEETFSEFENALDGSYKTAWHEVVADNLRASSSDESSDENRKIGFELNKDDFCQVVELFIKKVVNSEMPHNLQ